MYIASPVAKLHLIASMVLEKYGGGYLPQAKLAWEKLSTIG